MSLTHPRVIELTEYVSRQFAREEISETAGEMLWQNYGRQVGVEFPSPKTGGKWSLTAQGWVGHIPLTSELGFALQPKVRLGNLFGMLEYAYNLKSFHVLAGLINCQSLVEFYEHLANMLAKRVLDRARKGLYRAYLAETDQLPYVRGRLDVQQSSQRPGQVRLNCHYEAHTADVAENQILAWTLFRIARSGMCTERVLPTVRRAYRALQDAVKPVPFSPEACLGRLYNRLNDDYRSLHALCRFFLEQSGPGHQLGDRTMLPFLVDMAHLYERFVAEWLKAHLPSDLSLKIQERVNIDEAGSLNFNIDLVLYDTLTGAARWVLDTKYKLPERPSSDDISQVITYAVAKGCREAILIYPAPLSRPLDETIGDIHVRSLTFALAGDLEQAGQAFMQDLGIISIIRGG